MARIGAESVRLLSGAGLRSPLENFLPPLENFRCLYAAITANPPQPHVSPLAHSDFWNAASGPSDFSTFLFLDLAISEVQKTSHWPTHHWNVMSEQRKSNWQHPNTYYREWEETPGTDECDTSQHPHP